MTLTYTDNFNRANETPLSTGWQSFSNSGTTVSLVSNAVTSSDGLFNAYAYRNGDTYGNNHYSEVMLASAVDASNPNCGPTARSSDDATHTAWWNGYRLTVFNASTAGVTVIYGGAAETQETIGADIIGNFAQGDVIGLGIRDSNLYVFQNGIYIATRTDTNNRIASGGVAGAYMNSDTPGAILDNWGGANYPIATRTGPFPVFRPDLP